MADGTRKRLRGGVGSCSGSSRLGQAAAAGASSSSSVPVSVLEDDGGDAGGGGNGGGGEPVFGDESTADVILHLEAGSGDDEEPHVLHLHSRVLLAKSRYFAALLSDRWRSEGAEGGGEARAATQVVRMKIGHPVEAYLTTLRLMYSAAGPVEATSSVQSALGVLPVAAEILYDECLSTCLRYVEAVPWSREEENQVAAVVSYLQQPSEELLARLSPVEPGSVEKMLSELVHAATHSHQQAANVKAFVARILSSHGPRAVAARVLGEAFRSGLKTVKDCVEDYSSPNCRGRHEEIEAMQRQSLHTAVVSGRHLLWLVERMIELGVAEGAVIEWSEQSNFTANLKRAFMDDVWRNNVPGLPAVLLRCTWRLASAMAAGSIVVGRDVRKKMVRDWLPVLITSKENALSANCNKQVHHDLEDVFLKLILTLPIADAQELLHQCLSFATRSSDDSSHLSLAFATWFRRACAATPREEGESEGRVPNGG